jgi:uncharacterized repeat protein (TIGR03803 family)
MSISHWAAAAALAATALTPARAYSANDKLLYSYRDGDDGAAPTAGFIADAAGNLYSTTFAGGTANQGTVFKLAPGANAPQVLYSFSGRIDGGQPYSTLVMDSQGSLYGTTSVGGRFGLGTVFKLAPDGTETVLHSFAGGSFDGASPMAGLTADQNFNLYGTTESGGGRDHGTIFKITTDGQVRILHFFDGSPFDGYAPIATPTLDSAGNVYATTLGGGIESNYCGVGCGTVVKVSQTQGIAPGADTVIHFFQPDTADGTNPASNLVWDSKGNLLGTTVLAGSNNCIAGGGCGVVFKLTPKGNGFTESVVYAFQGGADGAVPYSGLTPDGAGNFYGVTFEGGVNKNASEACNYGNTGCGVVFEITASGHERVIHRFNGTPNDGANPSGNLYVNAAGLLFGTTQSGGTDPACFENNGCGALFSLTP